MMPERITRPEQLDALPDRSIVVRADKDEGEEAWQWIDGFWQLAGTDRSFPWRSEDVIDGADYVFVVWRPGRPTDGVPRE